MGERYVEFEALPCARAEGNDVGTIVVVQVLVPGLYFARKAGISDTVRPAGDNTVVRPDWTGACFAGEQMVSTAVDGRAAVARGEASREGKTQPQGCG